MYPIILDSNIVFSAIHSKNSLTRDKLFTLTNPLYSCNFLFVEIFKHKERIFEKSNASDDEIYDYLEKIIQKIHFFNEELIGTENYFKAYHLVKDIDIKDIAFVALNIELSGKLWTRDIVLKDGLKKKGYTEFFKD